MQDFTYKALPWNIVFARGALAQLPEAMDKLGFRRAMVLCSAGQTANGEKLVAMLEGRGAGLFNQAAMHVPVETVAAARALAESLEVDCTVAFGGGSTTGLGKALAVKEGLPYIAIPTTYAGSEMTPIWAVTEDGHKVTARDVRAIPRLTIYDPELTHSLPMPVVAASGMNALAQAVVNIATHPINPMVACHALEAIRALVRALPAIKQNPEDSEARAEALYGASQAGAALGTGATSLHHRLCHIFGGTLNTPHAETHAILLPHSVAYNAAATEKGTRLVAEAMGVKDAAPGLFELAGKLGTPQSLKEIGVRESDLDEVAEITSQQKFNNPETVTTARVRAMLQRALEGLPPGSD